MIFSIAMHDMYFLLQALVRLDKTVTAQQRKERVDGVIKVEKDA